jgi:group II intron reverse transcriptase/maturase
VNKAKPFCISKWEVWEAYKRVKANKGAAGVDGQSIAEFEEDLKDNLFKIWNRMSSGSYFPPPVRRVDIPKDNGGTRPLGIPTVADRIAQTVVKRYLEPILEEHFHSDSYGYRPGKSAIEAIGVARQRCWRYDWVLDLDIKGFFDNLDHGLLMRAVRKHTDCKWVLLYIERWLKAPVQLDDDSLIHRNKGTPQGGVVSPLLANLFLHYAFDKWIQRQYPQVPFERYADDGICHCRSKDEAEGLRVAIERRFAECGLELNLQKTKIVYCKNSNRRGDYPVQKFDFLGFTFQPRKAKNREGRYFVGFNPAISNKATKSICDAMRRLKMHRWSDKSLDDLARTINPVVRGWINYYGRFHKSALYRTFQHLNNILVRWASRKYKRLRGHYQRACQWLQCIMHRQSRLFAHWQLSQVKAGQ